MVVLRIIFKVCLLMNCGRVVIHTTRYVARLTHKTDVLIKLRSDIIEYKSTVSESCGAFINDFMSNRSTISETFENKDILLVNKINVI